MGKHHLRTDKTCLNCRYVVAERFCPKCGQENTTTRHSFHHLFRHFFEDLTHYENSFWKTIKTLLLKPGRLTIDYLSGKRMSYLAPVRLYIFVSFVTFLAMALTLSFRNNDKSHDLVNLRDSGGSSDSITAKRNFVKFDLSDGEEKDSISNQKLGFGNSTGLEGYFTRTMMTFQKNSKSSDYLDRLKESMIHNIPKALFFYMPVFAFFLWLFHGKKRWFYFDHGIFTLHYFSFLLLTLFIFQIFTLLLMFIIPIIATELLNFLGLALFAWWVFYLFRSHSKVYNERKSISRLKVTALLIINSFLFIFGLAALFFYSAANTH